MRDAGMLAAMSMGAASLTEDELDDTLAYVARYLRQSYDYLEGLSLPRLYAIAMSANRLVALENGKRPALEINDTGEETR